jgi:hypothetical protein
MAPAHQASIICDCYDHRIGGSRNLADCWRHSNVGALERARKWLFQRVRLPSPSVTCVAPMTHCLDAYVEDKVTGELHRPHHIDLKTGMYRGKQVLKVKERI